MPDMETIRPALTPEEWATALRNEFDRQALLVESCDPVTGNDHRRAALSLYGQPFGFTREERTVAEQVALMFTHNAHAHSSDAAALRSIAGKIAALLPPEGP